LLSRSGALSFGKKLVNAFDQGVDVRLRNEVFSPGCDALLPVNIVGVTAVEDAWDAGCYFTKPGT
jgi:hypothetical protein